MTNVITFKGKTNQEISPTQSIIEQLFQEAYKLNAYPCESNDGVLLAGEIDSIVYMLTFWDDKCIMLTSEIDDKGNFVITMPDGSNSESNLDEYYCMMSPQFYQKFYNAQFIIEEEN